jgi:hypothetical protein
MNPHVFKKIVLDNEIMIGALKSLKLQSHRPHLGSFQMQVY